MSQHKALDDVLKDYLLDGVAGLPTQRSHTSTRTLA